jgi:hypothetical protein
MSVTKVTDVRQELARRDAIVAEASTARNWRIAKIALISIALVASCFCMIYFQTPLAYGICGSIDGGALAYLAYKVYSSWKKSRQIDEKSMPNPEDIIGVTEDGRLVLSCKTPAIVEEPDLIARLMASQPPTDEDSQHPPSRALSSAAEDQSDAHDERPASPDAEAVAVPADDLDLGGFEEVDGVAARAPPLPPYEMYDLSVHQELISFFLKRVTDSEENLAAIPTYINDSNAMIDEVMKDSEIPDDKKRSTIKWRKFKLKIKLLRTITEWGDALKIGEIISLLQDLDNLDYFSIITFVISNKKSLPFLKIILESDAAELIKQKMLKKLSRDYVHAGGFGPNPFEIIKNRIFHMLAFLEKLAYDSEHPFSIDEREEYRTRLQQILGIPTEEFSEDRLKEIQDIMLHTFAEIAEIPRLLESAATEEDHARADVAVAEVAE